VGDRVLSTVVDYAKGLLRKTDTVVRLGGDEFAFLMPETDQNAAAAVISRVRRGLLDEMEKKNWLVTFSMGALTFLDMPGSADEAIKLADDLMYSVKNNTKDAVKYSVYKK
jgi:diguanylate cyclase (GGDEF)-like protein